MNDGDPIAGWLYGRQMHGIRLGLENITELLRRLGDPQRSFRSVHVAGTDGKGSTCACTESMLRASGFKTGLYTSPNLTEFNERIKVMGEDISDGRISEYAGKLRPIVEDMDAKGSRCTFFEVTTAMAFMHFRDEGVDYAVVEVGLGGRYDATNVLEPDVCIICNISLEHTEYLGDTVEKIAYQKAGILKKGVPCITLNPEPAFGIIAEVARDVGAPLARVFPDDIEIIKNTRGGVSFRYKGGEYFVSIPGRHQARNAALALEAVSRLDIGGCFGCCARDGLSTVRWPCRMELLPGLPVIMDVTHTRAGSEDLAHDIAEIYGKVTVVFGALGDKDIEHIAGNLSTIAKRMIVTSPCSERAAPLEDVARIVHRHTADAETAPDVGRAIEMALEGRGDEMILVTGSFYMAGDALRWLRRTFAGF